MVRLITHNVMACPVKGCSAPTNYPLKFKDVSTIEETDSDFNPEFLKGLFPRLDWKALVSTAKDLGDTSLPETEPDYLNNPDALSEELLRKLNRVLLEINVQDGSMVCPSCGHEFVIRDGIPNMLLNEDEIRK